MRAVLGLASMCCVSRFVTEAIRGASPFAADPDLDSDLLATIEWLEQRTPQEV